MLGKLMLTIEESIVAINTPMATTAYTAHLLGLALELTRSSVVARPARSEALEAALVRSARQLIAVATVFLGARQGQIGPRAPALRLIAATAAGHANHHARRVPACLAQLAYPSEQPL